jgi:hypothetical protein
MKDHRASLAAFFDSEMRMGASGTVQKAVTALSARELALELVLVVDLLSPFGTLIKNVQGRDRMCFTAGDRNVAYNYSLYMTNIVDKGKTERSDLPRAVREKLAEMIDRKAAAEHEEHLISVLDAAADRFVKLDKKRLERWIKLHMIVILAYPKKLLGDLGRFTAIDSMPPGKVVTECFMGDEFGRLFKNVNDIQLVAEFKGYIAFMRNAAADTLHGEAADFWEAHKGEWPVLTVVMNRCLCVLLSNAPVEASFSMLRHTDTAERQLLLAHNRDLESFLHFNGPRSEWNLPRVSGSSV